MLKKIDASQLKLGMYIHDLSCDWMTHPFVRNRFLLGSEAEISKIRDAGIHDVVIDSARGLGAGGGDKIVRHESPAKWKVDPMRFINLA
jgi:hypothetical protein